MKSTRQAEMQETKIERSCGVNARWALLLAAALWGAACGGNPPGEESAPGDPVTGERPLFQLSGTVSGDVVPTDAKAVVLWQVTSGSPDYIYKFGEGRASGGRFTVSLAGPLPRDAMNSYGLGVGFVVLVPPSLAIEDGRVDWRSVSRQFLGASLRNAVIWRARQGIGLRGWIDAFPLGFNCGRCVDAARGFDSYEKQDCAQAEFIVTTPTDEDLRGVCNWT